MKFSKTFTNKLVSDADRRIMCIKLLKDPNGNFWHYEQKMDDGFHQVTVVDEDEGYYTNTNITWYLTDEELANCIEIKIGGN